MTVTNGPGKIFSHWYQPLTFVGSFGLAVHVRKTDMLTIPTHSWHFWTIEKGTISSQSSRWVRKNSNEVCTVTHWCNSHLSFSVFSIYFLVRHWGCWDDIIALLIMTPDSATHTIQADQYFTMSNKSDCYVTG